MSINWTSMIKFGRNSLIFYLLNCFKTNVWGGLRIGFILIFWTEKIYFLIRMVICPSNAAVLRIQSELLEKYSKVFENWRRKIPCKKLSEKYNSTTQFRYWILMEIIVHLSRYFWGKSILMLKFCWFLCHFRRIR
jgi:hypothetical protein